MKRSTINPDLQADAERPKTVQAAPPKSLGHNQPKTLRITPAKKGSGKRDVSVRHDQYLK